jgi:hypothetical protein
MWCATNFVTVDGRVSAPTLRHPVRSAYQPPDSITFFLSEQINHQQPASSTFFSLGTNQHRSVISHQPPAKRTYRLRINAPVDNAIAAGWRALRAVAWKTRADPHTLQMVCFQATATRTAFNKIARRRRKCLLSETCIIQTPNAI